MEQVVQGLHNSVSHNARLASYYYLVHRWLSHRSSFIPSDHQDLRMWLTICSFLFLIRKAYLLTHLLKEFISDHKEDRIETHAYTLVERERIQKSVEKTQRRNLPYNYQILLYRAAKCKKKSNFASRTDRSN